MRQAGRLSRKQAVVALATVALPLVLVGCGDKTTTSDTGSQSATTGTQSPFAGPKVAITESAGSFAYEPHDITVKVNDTIRWTNNGKNKHTVTATPGQTIEFKSATMTPGVTFEQNFTKAGT